MHDRSLDNDRIKIWKQIPITNGSNFMEKQRLIDNYQQNINTKIESPNLHIQGMHRLWSC